MDNFALADNVAYLEPLNFFSLRFFRLGQVIDSLNGMKQDFTEYYIKELKKFVKLELRYSYKLGL